MTAFKSLTVSRLVVTFFVLTAASGCAPPISEAEGLVTFQGQPLVCGAVIFVGPDGMTKGANIEQNSGRYHIKDVGSGSVGLAVVSYDPASPLDQEKPSNPKDPNKTNWSQPNVDRSKWKALPHKYEMVHSSGLTVQLQPGLNKDINIELE